MELFVVEGSVQKRGDVRGGRLEKSNLSGEKMSGDGEEGGRRLIDSSSQCGESTLRVYDEGSFIFKSFVDSSTPNFIERIPSKNIELGGICNEI